jgi:antitoxin ParD1/3/4
MATETFSITLPSSQREYIDERVQNGEYESSSEFIRELIRQHREEQDRRTLEELQVKLLSAIESLDRGEYVEYTPDYWEKLRQRVYEVAP